MASSSGLQAQQDDLQKQLKVLPLDTAPRHLTCSDVLAFAAAGGKAERQQAAALIEKAAAAGGITACEVCDRQGVPSTSAAPGEEDEQDGAVLRFAACTSLQFATRRLRVLSGRFLCGSCRAARSTTHLIHLLVPPPPGSPGDGREAELQEMLLHLAAVNGAPHKITSNPTSLASWGQQLINRAYALRTVAGAIRGWLLELPGGQTAAAPAAPGGGLALVRALLAARGGGKGGGKPQGKKRKGAQREEEEEGEEERRMKGGKGAKKKRQAAAAVAEAAVAAAAVPKKAAAVQKQQQGPIAGGGRTPKQMPAAGGKVARAAVDIITPGGPASGIKGKKVKTPGSVKAVNEEGEAAVAPLTGGTKRKQREGGGQDGGGGGSDAAAAPFSPGVGLKTPKSIKKAGAAAARGAVGGGGRTPLTTGGGDSRLKQRKQQRAAGMEGAVVASGEKKGKEREGVVPGVSLMTPQPAKKVKQAGQKRMSL